MTFLTTFLLAASFWRPVGPAGGEPPRKIVVHPTVRSTMYAPAAAGILKSTDSGQSWAYVHYRRPDRMFRLAINPVTPNVIVAAGPSGMLRSTDDGASWLPVNAAPPDALAYAPDGTLLGGFGDGMKRSADNGTTWTASGTGLPSNRPPSAITVDSRGVIYAVVGGSIFRSSDNGNRWTSAGRDPGSEVVNVLTIAPNGTLYAALPGSLRRSTDGGASWSSITSGLDPQKIITDVAVVNDMVFASLLNGGVYRFTGSSWMPVGDPSMHLQTFSVTGEGSTVFATSAPYGITRSEDGGTNWTPSNRGFSGQDVRTLALVGGRLYAGTFDTFGLFSTTDYGFTWTTLRTLVPSPIMSLAIHPTQPSVIYAGTGGAGVITSTDGGATWKPSRVGNTITTIAVDPTNPSVAYAASLGATVIKTTNGGESWAEIGTALSFSARLGFTHIAVDPLQPSVVYLAGDRLYVSRDAGTTFTAVPNTTKNPLTTTRSAVYSFVSGVLSRSTDGGMTWTAAAGPRVPVPVAIAVDESTGDIFQVVMDSTVVPTFTYVLRSVGGGPWQRLPALPDWTLINAIVAANGTVYVGTTSQGVFVIDLGPRRRAARR